MSIKTIQAEELRTMGDKEALILQGCGGSLDEWVDGINDMLTQEGILKEGSHFTDCTTFEHDGVTCLLFPMTEDVKLDVGRLAAWRLSTYGSFGGTWLSDYVPNKLGGFLENGTRAAEGFARQKPDCPLIGQDGNIFNLMGIAARTLRENGMAEEAKEMTHRVTQAGDYYNALGIIDEYVNITSADDEEDYNEEWDEDPEEEWGMEL